MLNVTENPDKELVEILIELAMSKKQWVWRIWALPQKDNPPLDSDVYTALIQRFPNIPKKYTGCLDLFERNDTSVTKRSKMHTSAITLPALWLEFEDPEVPGFYYCGFIEGRENLNNFLRDFIKAYNEQCPLDFGRIIKEAK